MSKLLALCIVFLAASISVSAQTYTVIHNLGSEPGDPGGPWYAAAIAQSRGGRMFTTSPGSQHGIPAAFRIGPLGSIHILHQYGTVSQPVGGLTLARDGRFYGITQSGGPNKAGTVFRMSQSGGITKLHDFTGTDGAHPNAAPIQSVEGDFYLTTGGGAFEDPHGSIQRMTTDGNMTLLHTFNGSDGSHPFGPLVQGTDYRFYGVTQFGGANNVGTIFRVSSTGDFEVLYNFDNTHGSMPQSGLIQANDGNFYGTTVEGGPTGNAGVLFRVTPSGGFTVLYDFARGPDFGGPIGGLVQASDGNLYGTTTSGGDNNSGVIFRATLSGVVDKLHSFGPDAGVFVVGAPFQHTNGKLYGGTFFGGKFKQGVFFSLDAGLPPFVTYLPTYGRAGGEVQILGQGFTDKSQVFFNGTPASFNLVYPTFIKATVPDAATTGPITVTTTNGTLTSNKVFIVHP